MKWWVRVAIRGGWVALEGLKGDPSLPKWLLRELEQWELGVPPLVIDWVYEMEKRPQQ